MTSEFRQFLVCVFPVQPRNLVVLAIGVVVTSLTAADFIPTEQHRNALRQE